MFKKTYLFIVLLVAVVALSFAYIIFKPKTSVPKGGAMLNNSLDSKNCQYTIDGKSLTLINGKNEEAIPGSASKNITNYFGNDVAADFNNDSYPDNAFLLTQNTGGSGTFYYLAVALGSKMGCHGTNAILLGDRIAPQSTTFTDGRINVNYADRKAGEAMTAVPSVGVSKYFKVVGSELIDESLALPLSSAAERITKKPFGIKVSPQNSPIQPEKFSGYHTGVDFEIFPGEENIDVPVSVICQGILIYKNYVKGYGGVAIEKCTINQEVVTVLYGHLKLSSITNRVGDELFTDAKIAILGKAYSQETDGERKHLHLSIHKSSAIELRGYVSKVSELSAWIDPQKILPL